MSMYLWTAASGLLSSILAVILSCILIPVDVLLSLVMPRPKAPEPRTIVITGATSGIGKALAVSYAKAGTTIVISGRSPERLAEAESECKALGAKVICKKIDVTDEAGMTAWLSAVHAEHEIDMVVANAGVSEATCGTRNDPARAARVVLPINITGVMNTVVPLIDAFKTRGSGQIVIVSSLASFGPLTGSSSYSASKSAIKVWGEALRTELACFGVNVNVVCPGFVRSPMTAVNKFPMPGLIGMDEAVRCIRAGLVADLPVIAFPSSTYCLAELMSALPATARDAAARFGILPGAYFYRKKPRASRGSAAAAGAASGKTD